LAAQVRIPDARCSDRRGKDMEKKKEEEEEVVVDAYKGGGRG
jgi:hypothetical protein